MQDVLTLMTGKAAEHDVQIEVRAAPPEPIIVKGSRVQVQQVLVNLILNAIEAIAESSSEERRILVRLERAAGQVEVRIEDTGPGLKNAEGKLFDPFYTTKRDGMGMGLAICRTIVLQHRGKIWADTLPSGGAVVAFAIPSTEIQ